MSIIKNFLLVLVIISMCFSLFGCKTDGGTTVKKITTESTSEVSSSDEGQTVDVGGRSTTVNSNTTGNNTNNTNTTNSTKTKYITVTTTTSKDTFPPVVPGPSTTIDDTDISTSLALNKITFSGKWNQSSDPGMFNGSNNWCWTMNNFYSFKFKGKQFEIISDGDTFFGISDVYIDGKKVGSFDQYESGKTLQKLYYRSVALSSGEHTVKVLNTNRKNENSTADETNGACVSIDKIVVR